MSVIQGPHRKGLSPDRTSVASLGVDGPLQSDGAVAGMAQPDNRGSVWSLIAPLSAAVAGLGVVNFSSLSLLAAPAAMLAIVAGTLGVIRDRRTVWRVLAGVSALAAFGLAAVSAIVIFVLSAGGPTN